jgi:formate hydrogenlyase subunit 6/NADH:ubiquinone oxidoreductase subunit I
MAGLIIVKEDVNPMKFGTMLSDITSSLFRRPATENYPAERQRNPARLRSFLKLRRETCTGCGLCALDCPAKAIEVTMLDRKERRFIYTYHADQCLFCGQCVETCNQDSLVMVNDQWELAALDKQAFTVVLRDAEYARTIVAAKPASDSDAPEKA